MQDDLLRAPRGDFRDPQLVFVAAIHAVNRAELLQLLPGLPELADDGSVELHLVDLASDVTRRRGIAVRIRVRRVEILMRTRRDAERPRVADVIVDRAQDEVVVEHLDARVAAIGHIDVALRIDLQAVRRVHLARRGAARPDRLDELAELVELDDARVGVAVGDENVALRIPADVGGTAKRVRLRVGRRRAGRRPRLETLDGLRPAADRHQHLAVGTALDHHVRPLVHGPDVVLLVHTHGVGEQEAVEILTDLLDEHPVLIELEEACPRTAGVNEHMPFRIGGDADAFAQVQIVRKLERVRHRVKRDLGDVLHLRLGLGIQRQCREQHHDSQAALNTPHWSLHTLQVAGYRTWFRGTLYIRPRWWPRRNHRT